MINFTADLIADFSIFAFTFLPIWLLYLKIAISDVKIANVRHVSWPTTLQDNAATAAAAAAAAFNSYKIALKFLVIFWLVYSAVLCACAVHSQTA